MRNTGMRICSILALFCVLAGCVTVEVDDEGREIKPRELEKEMVIDDKGRIVARPTLLIAPHTIIINGNTPTEREIRLLGVEGLPEDQAPVTFARTQQWMAQFLAREQEIFVYPAIDTDLNNRVIYGIVYIYNRERETGEIIPGRYEIVNQAMLSQGLVKIRNVKEFPDEAMQQRMLKTEEQARRKGLGLWSNQP
jgi:hypothetical protein